MKRLIILLLLSLVLLQGCNLAENDIREQSWKYSKGKNFGDWINFQNSVYEFSNDTIYFDKIPIGKITTSKTSFLGSKRTITIESLNEKTSGLYVEK